MLFPFPSRRRRNLWDEEDTREVSKAVVIVGLSVLVTKVLEAGWDAIFQRDDDRKDDDESPGIPDSDKPAT